MATASTVTRMARAPPCMAGERSTAPLGYRTTKRLFVYDQTRVSSACREASSESLVRWRCHAAVAQQVRRDGLKSHCPKGYVGSTPTGRTSFLRRAFPG